ncbi:hypothetical protein K523DRAFT_339949 [Schizophyllum commune Tattone D]|nr:hypothetical protein K523DRAFT_339949 [Schizophyllum commune Tattone D]
MCCTFAHSSVSPLQKRKTGAAEWGKYGLITETDIFSKGQEFHTWLLEERKINPENLTKEQSKKEFARFIEDFNTATLPHEKFYNMDAYEKRMDAMRSGQTLTLPDDGYDPNADMRALAGARKKKASEAPSYLSRDQLEELRKVQNERVQAGKMKLLGMDIKPSFGVRMEEAEDEE